MNLSITTGCHTEESILDSEKEKSISHFHYTLFTSGNGNNANFRLGSRDFQSSKKRRNGDKQFFVDKILKLAVN